MTDTAPLHAEVDRILGPGGLFAKAIGPTFEDRPSQREMAHAVLDCLLGKGRHLMVEAPTGTGKGGAYLVAAHLAARAGVRPVLVSSHTLALQTQLLEQDIPLLERALGRSVNAAVARGRSNYVSLRRLALAPKTSAVKADPSLEAKLDRVGAWAARGAPPNGERRGLDPPPEGRLWGLVQSDSDDCLRENCPKHKDCHYFAMRREAAKADIIVSNHALLCLNLAHPFVAALPPVRAIVVDEAHTLEAVAMEWFGDELTERGLARLLDDLGGRSGHSGFLGLAQVSEYRSKGESLADLCREAVRAADRFWAAARRHGTNRDLYQNGRIRTPGFGGSDLDRRLRDLHEGLQSLAENKEAAPDGSARQDLYVFARKIGSAADAAAMVLECPPERCTVLEGFDPKTGKEIGPVKFRSVPVPVAPILNSNLFRGLFFRDRNGNATPVPIALTSATLTAKKSFDFLAGRLGVPPDTQTLALDSPFDLARAMRVSLGALDPGRKRLRDEPSFGKEVGEAVVEIAAEAPDVGVLVLFTAWNDLNAAFAAARDPLLAAGRHVYRQEREGASVDSVVAAFRNDGRGILFGVDSCWTGIDVPGDALGVVVIAKLPFPVPSDPVVEMRTELVEAAGKNGFTDVLLPEALVRFRQGVGRLIRRRTDTGVVVVLDGRIESKGYGGLFLAALPACLVAPPG